MEHRALAEHGAALARRVLDARAPARPARAAASRRAAAAARRPRSSSTRHQSTASPTSRSCGSRRPRRSPGPPTSRSSQAADPPAPSAHEYQPFSPPMPSITRHSACGGGRRPATRARRRTARRRPSRGRSAAGRSARRACDADDQRRGDVGVAGSRLQRELDRAVEADQPARAGRARSARCRAPCTTTSCTRLSTSGRAMAFGTGRDEPDPVARQRGVSTGTGTMIRRLGSPATRGVALHHLAVGQDVGAADVERAADVGRHASAAPTR